MAMTALEFDDVDRQYTRICLAIIVLLLLVVPAIFTWRQYAWPAAPATPQALSTVLVSTNGSHGSGVHIGYGAILTAAHVVGNNATMEIADSLGHKQPAKVLWANKAYDVALIHVDHSAGIARAPLNCAAHAPFVGEDVAAIGNPINLQFIHTYGRVASAVQAHEPWAQAFLIDATIAPGMSGGGVFDKAGNLVGLAVGIAIQPFNTEAFAPYAISYVVPIAAACTLMGRA